MPRLSDWKYELYNEDCFDTFQRIPDQFVDLVLVDPPYGTTQCKWDSIIPLEPMWRGLERVLKPSSVLAFTTSQPFTSVLILSCLDWYKYELVWEKERTGAPGVALYRPLPYHETIQIFGRRKTTYNPQMKDGKPYRVTSPAGGKDHRFGFRGKDVDRINDGVRFPRSVLQFTTHRNNSHPTQKPVALMEYLVRTYSNEGDIVLDFAMGSGTTGVACGNLNRRFIGCDNDTEHGYFKIAQERIREAYATAQATV